MRGVRQDENAHIIGAQLLQIALQKGVGLIGQLEAAMQAGLVKNLPRHAALLGFVMLLRMLKGVQQIAFDHMEGHMARVAQMQIAAHEQLTLHAQIIGRQRLRACQIGVRVAGIARSTRAH